MNGFIWPRTNSAASAPARRRPAAGSPRAAAPEQRRASRASPSGQSAAIARHRRVGVVAEHGPHGVGQRGVDRGLREAGLLRAAAPACDGTPSKPLPADSLAWNCSMANGTSGATSSAISPAEPSQPRSRRRSPRRNAIAKHGLLRQDEQHARSTGCRSAPPSRARSRPVGAAAAAQRAHLHPHGERREQHEERVHPRLLRVPDRERRDRAERRGGEARRGGRRAPSRRGRAPGSAASRRSARAGARPARRRRTAAR